MTTTTAMKKIGFATVIASGLTAAGLGLAAPVEAAPAGPGNADQTISQLQAQGYKVIVNRFGSTPLDQATVSAFGPARPTAAPTPVRRTRIKRRPGHHRHRPHGLRRSEVTQHHERRAPRRGASLIAYQSHEMVAAAARNRSGVCAAYPRTRPGRPGRCRCRCRCQEKAGAQHAAPRTARRPARRRQSGRAPHCFGDSPSSCVANSSRSSRAICIVAPIVSDQRRGDRPRLLPVLPAALIRAVAHGSR